MPCLLLYSVAHLIRSNARRFFRPGSWLALDELVFPWHGKQPLKVWIPRKPHPNGFLVYLVCCRMPNGKSLVVDIVFDWNPSKLADRRTPTEVLAETARRLRSELHYADHRRVLHNDAAFGGALGADHCAAVGVEAVNSTLWSSVHRLLQLLAPRLKRNQYFIFSEPRGGHSLTYIVRKVCDHFEKIQKVDGKNKLVKVKEERILVNTSTHALAPEQRTNPLAADQLSDTDLRPLLTLPRTTLVGLARVIVQKSGMALDSDEAPSAN